MESVEKCDVDDYKGRPTYSIKRVYRTHNTDGSLKKLTETSIKFEETSILEFEEIIIIIYNFII